MKMHWHRRPLQSMMRYLKHVEITNEGLTSEEGNKRLNVLALTS
ncbi:hypothetical protein HanXRQr2_Chr08g0346051 [Helianthus annuus]|uniref:Uncharacterized protein n=1 Tax=Helianthus annuus TaxID=4232 RepID=A0A9K3IFE2_HELAN|nr:hypothetical protein HanXRQr2_Chr08g0346051 [Helianthus annuus]